MKLLQHLKNWATEYALIPILMLALPIGATLAYALSGRQPTESLDWLVGEGARIRQICLAIIFTSVSRQAFGTWFTRDQLAASPALNATQSLKSLAIFAICAFVLSH